MKYLKPNASRTQRAVHDSWGREDTGAIIFACGLGGAIFGVLLGVFSGSLFFLLLMIFPLIALWMIVVEERSMVEIGHVDHGDPLLDKAEKYMTSFRKSDVESLAQPVYVKIFEHARFHTKGQTKCSLCATRLLALENLLPAEVNYQDDSDVHWLLDFLEARKELGE